MLSSRFQGRLLSNWIRKRMSWEFKSQNKVLYVNMRSLASISLSGKIEFYKKYKMMVGESQVEVNSSLLDFGIS